MNKKTLSKEIYKELSRLNGQIDVKIIKGRPYKTEARRHKILLSTLRRLHKESTTRSGNKWFVFKKSPVRRRLEKGVSSRLLPWNFA